MPVLESQETNDGRRVTNALVSEQVLSHVLIHVTPKKGNFNEEIDMLT